MDEYDVFGLPAVDLNFPLSRPAPRERPFKFQPGQDVLIKPVSKLRLLPRVEGVVTRGDNDRPNIELAFNSYLFELNRSLRANLSTLAAFSLPEKETVF